MNSKLLRKLNYVDGHAEIYENDAGTILVQCYYSDNIYEGIFNAAMLEYMIVPGEFESIDEEDASTIILHFPKISINLSEKKSKKTEIRKLRKEIDEIRGRLNEAIKIINEDNMPYQIIPFKVYGIDHTKGIYDLGATFKINCIENRNSSGIVCDVNIERIYFGNDPAKLKSSIVIKKSGEIGTYNFPIISARYVQLWNSTSLIGITSQTYFIYKKLVTK